MFICNLFVAELGPKMVVFATYFVVEITICGDFEGLLYISELCFYKLQKKIHQNYIHIIEILILCLIYSKTAFS